MAEIESLERRLTFASSNLPVTLHRALGLPVLVIETAKTVSDGENGEQINKSAQLRVSAPNGSDLAKLAQSLADKPSLKKQGKLLDQFKNLPVIWLDGEHYSVYLPNCSPAETQQAVMEAVKQPAPMAS